MIKLITIIGARPQFIKAAALSREISKQSIFNEIIIHTGQHYDTNMSDVFFDQLNIPKPKYSLDINKLSSDKMIANMISQISNILDFEKPDYVLVYGDTNSTLAGAISSSYNTNSVKLIHVESGLRSFNFNMPEEKNRILTDNLSDILFCPTSTAIKNLEKENFKEKKKSYLNSGDIMYDNLNYFKDNNLINSNILKKLNLHNDKYILSTIHRFENTSSYERMKNIIDFLNKVNSHTKVIFPIHPNTKNLLKKYNLKTEFKTIDPLNYFDMLSLINYSDMVISDSGGIQKEAFFFKKKCAIIREETEWKEILELDAGVINPIINCDKMLETYQLLLSMEADFSQNPYGSGVSAKFILDNIKADFNA
jgi:UDP-GlcNAc3NAcA epimerase